MKHSLLAALLFVVSCGSNDTPSASSPSPNQTPPEVAALNESAAKSHATALQLAELMLGSEGVADTAEAIRSMPLTTATEVRAWRAKRDALRVQLEDVSETAAVFALEARSLEKNRQEFLDRQALGFPWTNSDVTTQGGERVAQAKQPFVVAALAVTTFTIGAYRFLKGCGELMDNTQRMVYSAANGSEDSRKAVIAILRKKGVDISESATAEDVIEIFKEQRRDLRRSITTEVEAWNESKFNDSDPSVADEAETRIQEARNDVDAIANEAGAFAVSQTVTMVQNATGGLGSVVGGVPGATADLVLTATEKNPTDIVQRHVTVYVAGGEKSALPTETTSTSPTDAIRILERVEAGDQSISPEEIRESAIALVQDITERLRAEFGSTVQLATTVALSSASLDAKKQVDGAVKHDTTLKLPNFANGEVVEVAVIEARYLPQEVTSHTLGPNNPLALEGIPLLGTISVETTPGATDADGFRSFDVTAKVIRVPNSTQLSCQVTNGSCTPSSISISADSSASFNVQVTGRAQVRLVRHDTGESYSMALESTGTASDPGTPADLDPELIGTWSFTDSEDETYAWVFRADGTCAQETPTGSYAWQWAIEDGQLKLFSGSGTPTYKQYKIEGSLLYFWVDSLEIWAEPFVRE